MFLMHAVYGLGATVAPLVATEFVKKVPHRVYLYFSASLGLALVTALALISVFRGRTEDQVVGRRVREVEGIQDGTLEGGGDEKARSGAEVAVGGVAVPGMEEKGDEVERVVQQPKKSGGKMKAIMSIPAVHYMAFYITIYVSLSSTIPLC
jgi:hypothetical protein